MFEGSWPIWGWNLRMMADLCIKHRQLAVAAYFIGKKFSEYDVNPSNKRCLINFRNECSERMRCVEYPQCQT